MKKRFRIISAVVLIAVILFALTVFIKGELQAPGVRTKNLSTSTVPGMPYARGPQLYDGTGHILTLRGAMIETPFAYLNQWQSGHDPLSVLNSTTFNILVQQWHMNAVRINISQWIYNLNPSIYLTKLDTAIQQANMAGLYVVLDFHDDGQSGAVAPYVDGMLHQVSLTWWKTMAQHYLKDPMILFDLINEPNYPTWSMWLHGDGADIVGNADVIAAIRSTGAKQLIVLEPGTAGHGSSQEGGWTSFDPRTITDPSIVYSKHIYTGVITGNPAFWDRQWSTLLNTHPIYYGEWAVLPTPLKLSQCTGLTSANADTITNGFLAYMGQRNASWTAWDFKAVDLVQDVIGFAPTSFAIGRYWDCGDAFAGQAGMGKDVLDYLLQHP